MLKLDSRRSCWTSPKGHHNVLSLMAMGGRRPMQKRMRGKKGEVLWNINKGHEWRCYHLQ